MATTTNGFPYPTGTDPADVPYWMQQLAQKTDDTFAAGGVGPTCRATQTSAQTLTTGVYAAVTFNAEDWDLAGMHSTVTNTSRVTATQAGKYRVMTQVSFAANSTGDRKIYVNKNSTQVAVGTNKPVSGFAATVIAFSTVYLAVGDYVEVFAQQSSGGNLNTSATTGETFIEVEWVSPS